MLDEHKRILTKVLIMNRIIRVNDFDLVIGGFLMWFISLYFNSFHLYVIKATADGLIINSICITINENWLDNVKPNFEL